MSVDPAFIRTAHRLQLKTLRLDGARAWVPKELGRPAARLAMVGLALLFVVWGAYNLDLDPADARLGLAAGAQVGPLGQAFGYWAPDLWPGQVVPSFVLGHLEAGGQPSSAAVRWPVALAGIVAGWMLARSMCTALGLRAALIFGVCWFGSLALIDRSAATGLNLVLGLATLASIDRMITRGSDGVAGTWAALAFLAGGWPPLVAIALAVVVVGRAEVRFSLRLIAPPLLTAVVWSVMTIWAASTEVWAASLTLPLTQRLAWRLGLCALGLGVPWSPFAILGLFRSVRAGWRAEGRPWVTAWFSVSLASLIGGTVVPGLYQVALVVVLTGVLVVAAASLESAWTRRLAPSSGRAFFVVFACAIAVWLVVMLYGSYVWNLTMPFYRPLGIVMSIMALSVGFLGWSALETGNSRRGVVTLMIIALGLKLAHWGYYVPEWNYRYSQGPWARAIGQWIPKRWVLYTFHDWPSDLAFFLKCPVRQLRSPHYLKYQPGPESKFVLLQASEYENWPPTAPPITLVAKFLDQSAEERVLARTAGPLPPPLGPNPSIFTLARGVGVVSGQPPTRR